MTSEKDEQESEIELQLETERKRSEDCLNRLKYLQADFENLKKRQDRQLLESRYYATEKLILQLLDVADELELAVKIGGTLSSETRPLLEGVEITLNKLRKVLEQEGVSPIECEGKVFDPTKHNAIESIEREGAESCTVGEEVRRGYMMREKVIRPSIVRVEVPPSDSSKSRTKKQQEKQQSE